MVATGELVDLSQVNDQVFSQKMMGEGYAVRSSKQEVYSPVSGKITLIFRYFYQSG